MRPLNLAGKTGMEYNHVSGHAAWTGHSRERRTHGNRNRCRKCETREEIGRVFAGVLEDAGVFKWDDEGRAALGRFLHSL